MQKGNYLSLVQMKSSQAIDKVGCGENSLAHMICLLIFSTIKWSKINYEILGKLEIHLKQRGLLYLPDTVTLLGEILRIQKS